MKNPRRRKTAKAVAMCALLFGVVSLSSMALAAFVTASGAKASEGGNVTVGVIQKTDVRFEDMNKGELKDFTPVEGMEDLYNVISFDAPLDDNSGRFRYLDDGLGYYEHLSVFLQGKVMPMNFIDKATVKMECHTSYSDAATPIEDAIEKGYIEVLTWEGGGDYLSGPVSLPLTDYDATRDSKTFAVNLGFRWGEAFHHMNPTLYFDDMNENGGGHLSDQEAMDAMKDFVRTIRYGKDYHGEIPEDPSQYPTLTFSVTLTAEIN